MNAIKTLDKLPVQPPPNLIGRDDLMQEIRRQLSPNHAVFLYGIAGVGKRAVAATIAAETIQTRRHVLWLTASHDDLQTLSSQVLRAYNIKAGGNAREMVVNLLQQHNPLIVVNGLESHELVAQFIWEYAQGRASVIALHLTAADGPWEPLLVRRLDPASSHQLFREMAGYELLTPDDPKLPQLLDDLQGHPLSLCLAALQMRYGLTSVAEFRRALPPDINDPIQRAMSVIETAFNLLDQASRGLLMAMSTGFSGGLSAALLARVLGTSAHQLCHDLMEHGFITRRDIPYYDIHQLIQRLASQKLDTYGHFAEAQERMLHAIAAFTTAHAVPNDELKHQALLLEMDNILNAALHCIEHGKITPLQQIIAALSGIDVFMFNWGYQPELDRIKQLASLERTLVARPTPPTVEAAEIIDGEDDIIDADDLDTEITEDNEPIPPELAATTTAADTQPRRPKDFPDSIPESSPELASTVINTHVHALTTPQQNLQMALDDATARNDRPEMARLAVQLGQLELNHNEIDPALDHFEQAVQLYQEIGDLGKLLRILEITAEQFRLYRSPQDAQNYAQRGLNIARQLGNDGSRCLFMGIVGDIRLSMGDSNGAAEAFKRAIKLSRLMGESENTGILLGKLATIYMDHRDYRSATITLSESIQLFEEAGRLDLMGRSLGNLGTALGHLGRWHEAGQRHAAALRIARQLEDVEEERFQLQNLSFVAESESQMRWAVNYARQALYLALLEDDKSATSEIAADLGRLLSSDPEAIGQVVILLQRAADLSPQPEIQQMLKDAKIRLRKREQSGRFIAPVEPDLLVYAGEAYRGQG